MTTEIPPEKTLRQKAEERLRYSMTDVGSLSLGEARKLAHELQVHQVELEMQNEELRQVMEDLEASQRRFFTLFNQAPVGYLVLDEVGIVQQVNETFCNMVQRGRDEIVGRALVDWIDPTNREMFLARYRAFYKSPQQKNFELRLLRGQGGGFYARLEGLLVSGDFSRPKTGSLVHLLLTVSDITARKEAEEALRQSEERYRLLAENARDIIYRYEFTPTPHFSYVSSAATAIIGFTPEEHYADPELGFKLVHPEDRHLLQALAQGEGENKPLVLRWVRKDGRVIWTEQYNSICRDAHGNLLALEGIARDITERMEAMEAICQGEERFRALFEGAAVGISDAQGVVVRVSQRLCDLLGYTPDELVGKTSDEITHPEDRPLHRELVEKMKAQELDSYVIEKRYLCKDGSFVWVNLNVFAVRDSSGRLVQRIGVTQDITSRKRALQALQEERQRFQDLFEHAPVAIWLEDVSAVVEWMRQLKTQGAHDLRAYFAQHPDQVAYAFSLVQVLDVNRAAVEMNAARSKQHLMENMVQTITEATLKVLAEELAALGEGKLHFEMETQSRRLDGRPLFTISRFDIPLLGAEATPDYSRMVFTAVDITALKNAERTLIAQEKLAGIGTLAAGMAHEINSPLQVVTGVAESLKKRLQEGRQMSSQDMIRRLDMLAHNAWRIRDIVRSMLEFTAGTADEIAMYSLNDITRATLTLLESQTKTWKNVMIELQLDEALPQIACDRSQMARVLISLLNNAYEAMPHGGRIGIQTVYDSQTERVYLRVTDSGLGVPEGIRKRIFDPFFTTKPVGSGMGLGLSVAAGILRAHGGDIELESTSPQGSVFKVSLPLVPPPSSGSDDQTLGRYT